MKKISIITPCYNEEKNLLNCIEEIKKLFNKKLSKYDYEHIISDNNSNDQTPTILKKVANENNKVKVILNSKNYGSVKSTFNAIKKSSGDAVLLFFPADLQDPVEKIPELIEKWESGRDFVVGCRDQRDEFFFMKYVRKLFYFIINKISYNQIPMNVSDFQLVDRKIINKFHLISDSQPFIRTLAFDYSDNYAIVSYKWSKRKFGKSKEPFKALVNTAMSGILSVSDAPFRLVIFLGLITSILSISYGFYSLFYNFFFNQDLQKGIPTLLISVLIFSGVQLLVLGFVGEYISAIHRNLKKNINVSEKETINFD